MSMISSDPLGFFQQKKEVEFSAELIVFPRIVTLNPLPVPFEELFGKQSAKGPLEDPVYPVATRDYQPGRPARHIHWKASLRHSRLQEKVFEPTQNKKVLFAIDVGDFFATGDEEGFEALLEVVASLALSLDLAGSSLSLITNGVTLYEKPVILPLLRGEAHLQTFLETLSALQMKKGQSFADLLRQSHDLYRGSTCFYFADGGSGTGEIAGLFNQYRIPTVFILQNQAGDLPEWIGERVFRLKEIHGGGAAVV